MYICHDAAQQSAVPYSNGGYIEMKVKLDVREIKHKTKHINLFHKTVMYLYICKMSIQRFTHRGFAE